MSSSVAGAPASTASTAHVDHAVDNLRIDSERLVALVPQARKRRSTLGAYLSLLPNRRVVLPLVAVLINLRHAPAYLQPVLAGYLINHLIEGTALHALPLVLGGTLALCLINISTTLPQRLLLARQRRALTAGLRRALMRRVHRLTFSFHDRSQVGALQNKFTSDVGKLEGLNGYIFETMLLQSVALTAMITIMAFKNWHLLLIMLLAVPINVLIYRVFWKPIRAQNELLRKAESSYAAQLFEALTGVRVTRAHAVELHTEERLGHMASGVASTGYRLDKLQAFFGSSAWASTQLLNMLVLACGVWYCTRKWIHVGDLTILLAYFGQISQGIDAFLNGMPAIAQANDALNSLAELFEREDHEDDRGKPALPPLRGEIELRQVDFRYPGSPGLCLHDVSLRIPAGTSVALVGPSGSGKSTTASLILGFYAPERGSVLIDGLDLATLDRRTLRQQVGVVSQDVVLFHDTILGNIAWGDAKPDRERAEEAGRQANAEEFIRQYPDGYLHLLGDRGAGLSGGQRQRLAIARALYRNPRLLILDEATSALDPESERVVQDALEILMRGRTTLIIAHRLSTVRTAGTIVVLEQGRMVEQGRFPELIERRGRFHALASGQLF